jgi:hypothetical protein
MKIFVCLLSLFAFVLCSSLTDSIKVASAHDKDERLDIYPIGAIITSILKLSSFQGLFGDEWVLLDGRAVSKNDDIAPYLTEIQGELKLPDARGKFLRMANNNARGDQYDHQNRELGSYQTDAFQGHRHMLESWADFNGDGSKNPNNAGYGAAGPYGKSIRTFEITKYKDYGKPRIAKETYPKNIAVNYYIKINRCGSDQCR